jgi:hypothetical protein
MVSNLSAIWYSVGHLKLTFDIAPNFAVGIVLMHSSRWSLAVARAPAILGVFEPHQLYMNRGTQGLEGK